MVLKWIVFIFDNGMRNILKRQVIKNVFNILAACFVVRIESVCLFKKLVNTPDRQSKANIE